jgi:hypothetical protein
MKRTDGNGFSIIIYSCIRIIIKSNAKLLPGGKYKGMAATKICGQTNNDRNYQQLVHSQKN